MELEVKLQLLRRKESLAAVVKVLVPLPMPLCIQDIYVQRTENCNPQTFWMSDEYKHQLLFVYSMMINPRAYLSVEWERIMNSLWWNMLSFIITI